MDKRTAGIIGLVASIIFCGLPGLCGLCIGPMFAIIGAIPGSEIDMFGSSEPRTAIITGVVTLLFSLIFVAIPVVVWYYTLRKKPAKAEVVDYTTPMPNDL
jgi:hypothetical protein